MNLNILPYLADPFDFPTFSVEVEDVQSGRSSEGRSNPWTLKSIKIVKCN